MSAIAWRRVAEPQLDGYDTEVTLSFATTETHALRPRRYTRRPILGDDTCFDGSVAVRAVHRLPPSFPTLLHAPSDHPAIELASSYVRRWPIAFAQFSALMDSFEPLIDLHVHLEDRSKPREKRFGSICGSDEESFGTMYATVYSAPGLAEAFVHELAHQKLRALGVSFETARRLIKNGPRERYYSPLREVLRPMSAVLHAMYSYTYVTALDVAVIRTGIDDAEVDRQWRNQLAINVHRLDEGILVIKQHAKTDDAGREFLDGFYGWSERVRGEARSESTA